MYERSRPRPSFPPWGSIIGAGELGFRVRDGNGHVLPAMAAGALSRWKRNTGRGVQEETVIWPSLTAY